MWTNGRAVGSLDYPVEDHMLGALLPRHGGKDRFRLHMWLPVSPTTTHPYTCPAYFTWLLCTGAGAAMTRQRAGMWEAEVHLAHGGIWVGQPGPCSWRALTQAAHWEKF